MKQKKNPTDRQMDTSHFHVFNKIIFFHITTIIALKIYQPETFLISWYFRGEGSDGRNKVLGQGN